MISTKNIILKGVIIFLCNSLTWNQSNQECPNLCVCHSQIANCSLSGQLNIPTSIPSHLTVLDISFNCIGIFSINPAAILHLEILFARYARINRIIIHQNILSSKLSFLDLSGNPLKPSDIPDLNMFPKLKTLVLNDCNLNQIPKLSLPELTIIHLSNNNIRSADIPSEFQFSHQLKFIDLSQNEISYISWQNFQYLSSGIESINLNDNLLMRISDSFLKDKHSFLTHLSISNNAQLSSKHILNILNGFKSARRLSKLDLRNTNLDLLDESSFKNLHFTPLDELYLDDNPITLIPTKLFNPIHRIKTLSLKNCNLFVCPIDSFKVLTDLNELYLDFNHINDFNLISFLSLFPTIRKLSLKQNAIRILFIQKPPRHFSSSLIEYLDLSDQKPELSYIESGIWDYMPYLKKLDLRHNLLTNCLLQDEVQPLHKLHHLEELYLDGNDIKRLSVRMFKDMKNLKYLSLSKNNVYTLKIESKISLGNIDMLTNYHSFMPSNSETKPVWEDQPHSRMETIMQVGDRLWSQNISVVYTEKCSQNENYRSARSNKWVKMLIAFLGGFLFSILILLMFDAING